MFRLLSRLAAISWYRPRARATILNGTCQGRLYYHLLMARLLAKSTCAGGTTDGPSRTALLLVRKANALQIRKRRAPYIPVSRMRVGVYTPPTRRCCPGSLI